MQGLHRFFSSPDAPTLLPHYAIGLYVYTHHIISTRGIKIFLGIDNNANPRQDLAKYGASNVTKGKITQDQLVKIQKLQAAHENAVEGLPFFLFSMLYASFAGGDNALIKRLCLIYTAGRIAYPIAYVYNRTLLHSVSRTIAYVVSAGACIYALYRASWKMNKGFVGL